MQHVFIEIEIHGAQSWQPCVWECLYLKVDFNPQLNYVQICLLKDTLLSDKSTTLRFGKKVNSTGKLFRRLEESFTSLKVM